MILPVSEDSIQVPACSKHFCQLVPQRQRPTFQAALCLRTRGFEGRGLGWSPRILAIWHCNHLFMEINDQHPLLSDGYLTNLD